MAVLIPTMLASGAFATTTAAEPAPHADQPKPIEQREPTSKNNASLGVVTLRGAAHDAPIDQSREAETAWNDAGGRGFAPGHDQLDRAAPRDLAEFADLPHATSRSPIAFDAGPAASFRRRVILGDQLINLEDERDPRRASIRDGDASLELYDLILHYDALSLGDVILSLSGGMRAMRTGLATPDNPDASRNTETMPVVGGGVTWRLDESVSLGGRATARPDDHNGSMLDFTAEASFQIRHNVNLVAGYQLIRADVNAGGFEDEVNQSGVFATVRIEF